MITTGAQGLTVSIVASGLRRVNLPLTNFLEMVHHAKSMRQLTQAVDEFAVIQDAEPKPKAMTAGAGK